MFLRKLIVILLPLGLLLAAAEIGPEGKAAAQAAIPAATSATASTVAQADGFFQRIMTCAPAVATHPHS